MFGALQENIIFQKDVIVKITNTTGKNSDGVFGKLIMVLFDIPGYIPSLIVKNNGDVSFLYSTTKPYQFPEYNSNFFI